jgi:hypothetical protein
MPRWPGAIDPSTVLVPIERIVDLLTTDDPILTAMIDETRVAEIEEEVVAMIHVTEAAHLKSVIFDEAYLRLQLLRLLWYRTQVLRRTTAQERAANAALEARLLCSERISACLLSLWRSLLPQAAEPIDDSSASTSEVPNIGHGANDENHDPSSSL